MLSNKTVIVTGGTTGIGKAIAARFVDAGANVVIAGRTVETGEAAAEELDCTFHRCDVSEYDQVEALVDAVVAEHGRLDTIVNNAGIGAVGTIEDLTVEDWHRVLSVNLSGVMYGSRAAMPFLKQSDGSIINVASIYGLVGAPAASAYAAAKGGVVNLTRSLAVDYAGDGVRVNSVCPGFVETPMTDEYLDQEQFYEFVRGQTPMGRVAQPEEIAGIVAFLASEDASYITGVNVPVDGGWTAH
ncbi:SDR family oxidoreductase [Halolamina litorea]|uniref:SDR family NAD(P)-dependent oxidoreductase n=1 Tax=Halolamina litorea TaxID=1515593 RepID=A0ABD6BVP3_9EURY|nr:SDR family NAD(P)-dependent oxidoreductase [Halolamina litorea]